MLLAAVVLISVSSACHVYTDKSVAEWIGTQLNDLPGIIYGKPNITEGKSCSFRYPRPHINIWRVRYVSKNERFYYLKLGRLSVHLACKVNQTNNCLSTS